VEVFLAGFAGRTFPKDPLKILPFFVFLSPLPMVVFFYKNLIEKSAKVVKDSHK